MCEFVWFGKNFPFEQNHIFVKAYITENLSLSVVSKLHTYEWAARYVEINMQ